jgi:hypothetical protein
MAAYQAPIVEKIEEATINAGELRCHAASPDDSSPVLPTDETVRL